MLWTVNGLVKQLKAADPDVQTLGLKVLARTYLDFPTTLTAPGGCDMPRAVPFFRQGLRNAALQLPRGSDILSRLPLATSSWMQSGEEEDLFVYKGVFTANPRILTKVRPI